jgi:PAS domain S-box-containing protein
MGYAVEEGNCKSSKKYQNLERANARFDNKTLDVEENNDNKESVDKVLDSLGMVVWSATYPDHVLTRISHSDKSHFNLKVGQRITNIGVLEQYVHHEDLHILKEAARQRELNGDTSIEYRIIQDDGTIRVLHEYSRIVFGSDQNPVRINGVITDITDREHTDQQDTDKLPVCRPNDNSNNDNPCSKEMEGLELEDIIDHKALQSLMDKFFSLTHIGVGIIDMEGNVLVSTGWQDICAKFHRMHPDTHKNCIESDLELSLNVDPGTYKSYKCKNNMWDLATPIMVGGKHMGNLFLGQFFYEEEKIPLDAFRNQAKRYGFEEKEYIEVLKSVPRWSHETVDTVMSFYTQLTDIISSLCYSNIMLGKTLDERQRAEKRLADETTRKKIFFEQSNDGIVVLNKNGRVLEANQKFADMLGYTTEELKQMYIWDWETQWTREEVQERFLKNPFSAENPVKHLKLETQHRRKDGSIYDVELLTNAMVVNGQEMHFSVCRDITKIKKAEKALKEHEERMSLAMTASGLGFWDLDTDTNLLYLSHAVYTLVGYETEEAPSSFDEIIMTFLHPDDRDSIFIAVEESIALLKPIHLDFRIKHISGEIKWVSIIGKPINVDENGRPHRITGILIDITARVNAEKTLLYARAAADESNRIKTEMIQNISHELRTPLIAVLGFSDVLLNDSENFTGTQKKFLQNIHESGNNLDNLIEKFLDLIHVEDGGMDSLNLENVNLENMINGIRDLLSGKASKKNIDIDVVIDPAFNTIIADPYKLRTILFNLIENAIKFTDQGGLVKIETKVNGNEILFLVSDTGVGMEYGKIESIFEPFVQIDGSSTRKFGGAGLGLALVRRLAEVHHGRIDVESQPGKGSVFTFSVPLNVPENSSQNINV